MNLIFALLFFPFALIASSEKTRYDNYRVYKVLPTTENQVEILRNLEDTNPDAYDFWSGATKPGKPAYIMVPPHSTHQFEDSLGFLGIRNEIYIANVQELIDRENPALRNTRNFGWENYYQLDEIYDFLYDLASRYPNIVTVIKGGESFQRRDILGVHVSFKPENINRTAFIEGGIHSREWISPATVTYLLNELVTSDNATIRNIAEDFDWYFFPVFNPDGYVYTHTTTRMWRKTRVPYVLCFGADPNRNWGYQWMQGGSSSISCSETYAGPSPFSEPSVRSMSEFITSIASRLYAYISFHSFSQLLLIPYGHTYEHLDNYDELFYIGTKAAEALSLRYGTNYTVGSVAEAIYIASGSSVDWVKGTFGTRITYIYELRDAGQYGFLLPPELIIPNCLETLDSFITIFQEAIALEQN